MPGADGMEVLRTASKNHPHVPVIMITAHGSVDQPVEAIKAGAFDYIEKPFEQEQIRTSSTRRRQPRERLARSARTPSEPTARRASASSASRRDAGDLRDHREGRRHAVDGAHHRRERHRQGAGRQALHEHSSRARRPVHQDQLRRHPEDADGVGAVRLREGRVHRRGRRASPAASSWPTAARCSSTRSARSRSRCR